METGQGALQNRLGPVETRGELGFDRVKFRQGCKRLLLVGDGKQCVVLGRIRPGSEFEFGDLLLQREPAMEGARSANLLYLPGEFVRTRRQRLHAGMGRYQSRILPSECAPCRFSFQMDAGDLRLQVEIKNHVRHPAPDNPGNTAEECERRHGCQRDGPG